MMNKFASWLTVILVAVVFFALVLLNNLTLSGLRLDLTENQVYTLSEGSKKVIGDIDEPINLYFFYSDKASSGMTSLRNYANRVESLLQEYNKEAAGKINLKIVDPEPFSESEDQANQFGLTAATIGPAGDAIYMGLAASNALDDQQVIPFFDPQQESFLEYEISKLIHKLTVSDAVKVTLVSDLPLEGGQNPMTGRFDPAWTFYSQLQQLYQVEKVAGSAPSLPEQTDVLLLVHPKNLSESMLFSIDQFVMNGGKLMAFVDPHNESDQMAMMAGMGANASQLDTLFGAWGIKFDSQNVVLDASSGLDIRTPNGGVARHFGFLGLGVEQLDRDDVTTAGLEVINGASFGHFSKGEGSQVTLQSLLRSSQNADLLETDSYAMTRDPQELARNFQSENQAYVLAARVTGTATSAFTQVPEGVEGSEIKPDTNQLNLILVGDSDLLADRFWVQQANFFGQTIVTPFANNGDLITNGVENLGGSDALISIRSRGTFARPFTVVEALTVKAEEKFREQEQLLQSQLEETEMQLEQLQAQQSDTGALVLTDEQQLAVEDFMQKKIEIRKALREVRHQLDKDIEQLGNWLKFVNIAVMPLVLMLCLLIVARVLRIKSKGTEGVGA